MAGQMTFLGGSVDPKLRIPLIGAKVMEHNPDMTVSWTDNSITVTPSSVDAGANSTATLKSTGIMGFGTKFMEIPAKIYPAFDKLTEDERYQLSIALAPPQGGGYRRRRRSTRRKVHRKAHRKSRQSRKSRRHH